MALINFLYILQYPELLLDRTDVWTSDTRCLTAEAAFSQPTSMLTFPDCSFKHQAVFDTKQRREMCGCDQERVWHIMLMSSGSAYFSSVLHSQNKCWAQETRIWLFREQAAESCYLHRTHWLVGLIKSQRESGGVVQLCNQHSSLLWIEQGKTKWTKKCSEWKCLPQLGNGPMWARETQTWNRPGCCTRAERRRNIVVIYGSMKLNE